MNLLSLVPSFEVFRNVKSVKINLCKNNPLKLYIKKVPVFDINWLV